MSPDVTALQASAIPWGQSRVCEAQRRQGHEDSFPFMRQRLHPGPSTPET